MVRYADTWGSFAKTWYNPYVGFSNALGSSLPSPAGDFSASSLVMRMSSASTLPCNKNQEYLKYPFSLYNKFKL